MPISASLKPSTQQRPGMLSWNDFSGGLNADHASWPLALAENELSDVLNYKYVRQGNLVKLKSRDGLTKASTVGAAGGAINGCFRYTIPAGADYDVVVADSDLKRLSGGQFFKIDDLYTAGTPTPGRMCQFNDKLIVADGSALKYWDGSTFGVLYDISTSYLKDYDNLNSATTTTNQALYNGATIRIGQLYTATHSLAITSVKVFLKKVGSPTGNVTFVIYAVDGTTVVATSTTTIDSAALTTSYVATTFALSATLAASTAYFLAVLYNGGDSSNYVAVRLTATGFDVIPSAAWAYIASWAATGYDMIMAITPDTSPYASWVIQKKNRLYCNHTPTNTLSSPNRLYYSNANDPNDWSTTNGGGFIIFDGHYKLNGAFVFNDDIYVFADQPKAIYKLSGDSPDEYTLKLMWRDITAISQDVIQNVGSDLIFQDTRGVISLRMMEQYGDIEKAIISRDKVNNTYVLPYSSQVSGKTISDNQYWLSTTSNYVLIYDQEQGIWTRFQLELGTSVTPTSFGVINGLTYIGCSDGNLYYLDYTKDQDNGVDFNLVAKTNWHDFGVLFDKDARFIDSVVISANNETYDLEIYVNLNTVTPLKTLSLVSLSQNGAFQSPYCGNLNEVNFNFKQIQAKVTAIASGTGPHWIDRIVVEAAILSHY